MFSKKMLIEFIKHIYSFEDESNLNIKEIS